MSASEKLSVRAYHHGKRPAYFRSSEKRHARVATVLLLVTGIVWLTAGWAWSLAPLAVAVYAAVRSLISRRIAMRLEEMEDTPL